MKKNFNILGYRHTGINCKNLKKSINFYCNYLGLKKFISAKESSTYMDTIYNMKNLKLDTIKLKMKNEDILELIEYKSHPTKRNTKKIHDAGVLHFALQVDSIDKIYKFLKSKKVKLLSKPTLSTEKFAKVCFCFDPDGTRIELVEILFKKY
tara:strand:+ start:158 stop:613 length:456 start_codon:yes stop_codon:yes gene_type:complete